MKKFRFPFQPVRTLRQYEEARAQEALAESIQAQATAMAELARRRTGLAALGAALTQERTGSFAAWCAAEAFVDYQTECAAVVAAERVVAEAEKLVQSRRAEYFKAHRRVEILNRLEAKARAVHRAELQREEQATYDERAARRGFSNIVSPTVTAPTAEFPA